MPLAAQLAERATGIRWRDLPDGAAQTACTGFADYGACLFLGLAEPVNTGLRKVFGPVGGGASLYFSHDLCDPAVAAMLNSAAAHASNIDDNALKGSHVSSVLAPAILAEAERIGASGRACVTAYVAGYETWASLVAVEADSYNAAGWHQTTALAPLAVAAAVANLTGMTAADTAQAIGIAASMTGGLVANFNGFVKPMQVGRAARAGIEAAALARNGFISSPLVLEGTGGLFAALSPKQNWSLDRIGSGEWQICAQGLNLKQYPNAATNHRALDGMAELIATHDIRPADVARIVVPITRHQHEVIRSRLPDPPARAPLLMIEPALAALLFGRRLAARDLLPEAIDRPDRAALAARVAIEVIDAPDEDRAPNLGYRSDLQVTLTTGETLVATPSPVALGHFTAPFTRAQLNAKFTGAAIGAGLSNGAGALFEALADLATLDSVAALPRYDAHYRNDERTDGTRC
ncbi:MmgE/PrpD family protein [Gemmobacter sp.]|uniref:MmgE/PrpD family protein n=1 Tax=Gemmobacter sp. TaxID=1898957 RepID=UPI002AFFA774|nr:MmgE/PrpD family protein [Gemmobacter sp.]